MKKEKQRELTPEEKQARRLKAAALFVALNFAIIGAALAHVLAKYWLGFTDDIWKWLGSLLIGGFAFGIFGLLISPMVIGLFTHIFSTLTGRLFKMPLIDIICVVFGLICGLVIGSLLGSAFKNIRLIGPYISLGFICAFGYVGMWLGSKKKDEVVSVITSGFGKLSAGKERKGRGEKDGDHGKAVPKILDTNIIIDGRIAEIYHTGFLEGVLVIPNFVLIELQHIADSSDPLKRLRGRRGLDILNKLREDFKSQVQIVEKDYPDIPEVDSKLLKLAKDMKGTVITNDFNLNKVAELQDVRVLNINDLANSLKPVVPPGEQMTLKVIKDGKENNQGIGYLDDGTMIVVENGRRYIGKTIHVMVTSVLQTSAGRMIFARPMGLKSKTRELLSEEPLLLTEEKEAENLRTAPIGAGLVGSDREFTAATDGEDVTEEMNVIDMRDSTALS